ncbi:MAG: PEGA domain-containing protein [Pseudomonadota bacterium]
MTTVRIRLIAIAAVFVGATACANTGGGPRMTTITSDPAGATVSVDGYGKCETPCTLALAEDADILIAKAGFEPFRMTAPGARRKLTVKLELAAPTEDVEETSLPAL